MRAFIDLDGVLVDYYGGICREFSSLDPWPYLCPLGDWDFFTHPPFGLTNEQVAPKMDREFYANLQHLQDAYVLVGEVERLFGASNVYFLSSPWDTSGCDEGKRLWVKRCFPAYAKRTLIGSCKEACAVHDHVLFDDSPKNVQQFIDAGGLAVLIPRPWNARHWESNLDTGQMKDCRKVVVEFKPRFDR